MLTATSRWVAREDSPGRPAATLCSQELAKGLERLNYLWIEEPMDEHSMSSFVWLCEWARPPVSLGSRRSD